MEEITKIDFKVFRYTFDESFNDELLHFAKIHQYDNKTVFKEEWKKWIANDDINSQINVEIRKLKENGFDGDILDKMYKSARYYFRKKKDKNEKEQKDRKQYIGLSKELLQSIDTHIIEQIQKNIHDAVSNISPGDAYKSYYNDTNHEVIIKEIILMNEKLQEKIDSNTFEEKIKKTYKNRFYVLSKKYKA